MPLGLRNAPKTFKMALDIILSGSSFQTCLVYLEDVIVFSLNVQEHFKHVEQVLGLLQSAGISLKMKKFALFRDKVN